jgi:hypothetical protein
VFTKQKKKPHIEQEVQICVGAGICLEMSINPFKKMWVVKILVVTRDDASKVFISADGKHAFRI